MPIIMVFILRLIAQFYEYQYHHIGSEIRERMDGIGYHGGRMPQDACGKLQHKQQHIDDAACYSHLVNFSQSLFFIHHNIHVFV